MLLTYAEVEMSNEGPGPTHYFSKKISWGEKERSILSSNHLDQIGIKFIHFFYLFRLKIGYIKQGPMILY